MHARDGGVREALGEHPGGLLLGAHAHRQGCEAAVQQVGGHRVQRPAGERADAAERSTHSRRRRPRRPSRRRVRRGTSWRCAARGWRRARADAAARGWRRCCRRAPGTSPAASTTSQSRPARASGSPASRRRPGRCRVRSRRRCRAQSRDLVAEEAALEDVVGAAVERAHGDDVRLAPVRRGDERGGEGGHAARERDAPSAPSRPARASSNRATPGCQSRW